ncbi:type II secretion system protein D precursor [mine drainage metagenome]|uniref:Type II secretion system protein D n=1 Tax=mine drainage metagenome TaxID=410659 RepID=A0A1J5SFR7_9ZZZZ
MSMADSRLRHLLSLGGVLLLAACAGPAPKPSATLERINDELGRAVAQRQVQTDAIDRALMPPLAIEMPKATADLDPRFDLSVVDAPAGQVFMALVSGTRYSMLLPPKLTGRITVNLKDVTLKEALDTLRDLDGYEYRVEGSRIFIEPNTLQSRVFQINYLTGRRVGSSDLRVTSSAISGSSAGQVTGASATQPAGNVAGSRSSDDTSRVSTSSDADFWRDLTRALTAIVGTADGRQVIVNPMSGVVVVRAFPADLRNVARYLKATQLVVDRQVMLEAKIVQVTLSDDAQSGINWSLFGSGTPGLNSGNPTAIQAGVVAAGTTLSALSGAGTPSALTGVNGSVTPGAFAGSVAATAVGQGMIGLAFQTKNFAALISFLQTQGHVAVLSSPRIATLNNQQALLKVGTDQLYVTNVSTTTTTSTAGGNVTTPSLTLQPYFSGISLDVTPQIDDDGNIILHVHPAVSTVSDSPKTIDLGAQGTYTLPLAASSINETDSIVRVEDGNIVAIGGLMSQNDSRNSAQLPGTSDSSLLGGLFGQRSRTSSKSEMVILIKPTIIDSDKVSREALQAVRGRLQAFDQGLDPGRDRSMLPSSPTRH